jgi:cystathionine beta-lyase/cystathionine gamma-synthase
VSTQGHEDGFSTRAIHAGEETDPATRAHATPIYQTATFAFETGAEKEAAVDAAMAWESKAFFYTRTSNPTTDALEEKVAALEGAEAAVACASGMAAVANTTFSLLGEGDHCVASEDVFIITRFFLDDVCARKGIEVSRVDTTDVEAVRAALRPRSKAVFVESLSNPHMWLADVPALAALARDAGAALVVDNTFLSPAVFRPLEHGADLVLHSATKYLAGHGDTVCGVVAGSKELIDPIRYELDALGAAVSPFNSWLVARGMRTLPLRMEAHSRNALAVARFLDAQPEVRLVSYPGLPGHPQHEMATRQLSGGYGGMMAIRLEGGEAEMYAFTDALRMCAIAVSLGDLKTLVYPMPKRDNLIRLSVGCEDVEDLLADLALGLAAARRTRSG